MAAVVAAKVKRQRSSRANQRLRAAAAENGGVGVQLEIDAHGRLREVPSHEERMRQWQKQKMMPNPNAEYYQKFPADQTSGFPNRQWPPRGREVRAEENHAKYRKKTRQLTAAAALRAASEAPKLTLSTEEEDNIIDQLDGEDGAYRASSSANVILYVGLGMVAIGLVITFVGLGDKGFRTLELQLIGPSLVGAGVFFTLLRILFCTVPSCCRACLGCCCGRGKKKEDDKKNLVENGAASGSNRPKTQSASSGRVAPAEVVEPSAAPPHKQPHHPPPSARGHRTIPGGANVVHPPNLISEDDEGEASQSRGSRNRENFRQKEIRAASGTSNTSNVDNAASRPATTTADVDADVDADDKEEVVGPSSSKPLAYTDEDSGDDSDEFSVSASDFVINDNSNSNNAEQAAMNNDQVNPPDVGDAAAATTMALEDEVSAHAPNDDGQMPMAEAESKEEEQFVEKEVVLDAKDLSVEAETNNG